MEMQVAPPPGRKHAPRVRILGSFATFSKDLLSQKLGASLSSGRTARLRNHEDETPTVALGYNCQATHQPAVGIQLKHSAGPLARVQNISQRSSFHSHSITGIVCSKPMRLLMTAMTLVLVFLEHLSLCSGTCDGTL